MTIEEAFGAVIRKFRKERQLSQDELSDISSLDRGFISKIERGKQQPTLVTIFELSAALCIPAGMILSETELLWSFHKIKINPDLKHVPFENIWELFGGKLIPDDLEISCNETILIVLIRSNSRPKRLSSPNVFIGDPDFKDLKDWIPDYYLGNDRLWRQAAN